MENILQENILQAKLPQCRYAKKKTVDIDILLTYRQGYFPSFKSCARFFSSILRFELGYGARGGQGLFG